MRSLLAPRGFHWPQAPATNRTAESTVRFETVGAAATTSLLEGSFPMPRVLLAALLSLLAVPTIAQEARPAAPEPVKLTAQQDHKLMMDALGIRGLREGANGMNPRAPNAANYDEAKANPYPNLPDPLTLKNGQKVTPPEAWWSKRRPEIVEDFDSEVYGRVPRDVPRVTWEVTATDHEKVGDVAVVTKKLVGHVDNARCPEIKVDIQLTLTTPAA